MSHLLLYGGTFDPIHHGHLILARAAREQLRADQVLFLPARLSPHKQDEPPGATDAQRLEMLNLAIQSDPSGFAVDTREFNRGGPSYTFDTLQELKQSRPRDRFTLLIGTDQLAKLHTWHRVGELLQEAKVAILGRPSREPLERSFAAVEEHLGAEISARLRQSILLTPLIEISSTHIRYRVRQGLSIAYLVPESVALYITAARLYLP